MPKIKNFEPKYGHVLPREGRYGICGWDVIVKDFPALLFSTKRQAVAWMKKNGYELLPC